MFTVVIPLYNKEKYIRRAVDSVLSQNYENFELIIINDGSTDKSLEQLKNITDNRMRIINQINSGVGAARNKGFENSKYQWIALLDADDMWKSNHLNELSEIIESYPLSGMVSTKVCLKNTDSKVLSADFDSSLGSDIKSIDYFYEATKDLTVIHSSSVCINKKVYNEIGGFSDYKMGEDLEYWARISLNYPVAISDKITSYYVRETGGVTENQRYDRYTKISNLNQFSPEIKCIMSYSENNPSTLQNTRACPQFNLQ